MFASTDSLLSLKGGFSMFKKVVLLLLVSLLVLPAILRQDPSPRNLAESDGYRVRLAGELDVEGVVEDPIGSICDACPDLFDDAEFFGALKDANGMTCVYYTRGGGMKYLRVIESVVIEAERDEKGQHGSISERREVTG